MRSTASASCELGITRVGPPASVRRISWATPPPGTCRDLSPVAGSPRSWKPQAASNIVIPAKAGIQFLDNDVHQSSRHDHDLLRLLPVHEFLHARVGERERLDLLARGRGG